MSRRLSAEQQSAVHAPGHLLIAACPGSGKTTVLTHRASHLLEQHPDARLAAVTFTREAAESLQRKIHKAAPDAASRLDVGTFHSLCMRQLGVTPHSILEGAKRRNVLVSAMTAAGIEKPWSRMEEFEQQIEEWDRTLDLQLPDEGVDPMVDAYRQYQALKRAHKVIDFADIMRQSVLGMRQGKVKPLQVAYMLVDEFQDTDQVQLQWVLEHVSAGVCVSIVGDDDQSIYGWRGGLGYGGMSAFRDVTQAQQVNLDRTYRCSQPVLAHAGRLIFHNRARIQKVLTTANQDLSRASVSVARFSDRKDEARGCADFVRKSGHPGRWGVLARTNGLLAQVELAFQAMDVPYALMGSKSVWTMRGPALVLGVCNSLVDGQMLGVEHLLQASGVGPTYLERVRSQVLKEQPEGRGAVKRFLGSKLPAQGQPKDREIVAQVREQLSEWTTMLGDHADVSAMIKGVGYYVGKYCHTEGRKPEAVQAEANLVNQAAEGLAGRTGSLVDRLRQLAQARRPTSAEDGCARLMTLHRSKGLEFDSVWIYGCEQGTLPSANSDVDEERRLMYVGMTRAIHQLTLSFGVDHEPSQFLSEAGLLRVGLLGADDAAYMGAAATAAFG